MLKMFSFSQLIAFVFESKAAVVLILINVIVFGVLQTQELTQEQVAFWILYPEHLWQGSVWALVTSGFIHLSWSHFAWNMLGVFVFVGIVESCLGFYKTVFLYLGSLVISMLFATVIYDFILEKHVGIIGASGAIMGMVSAAMLLKPFAITYEMLIPLPVMVKGWLFCYADIQGLLSAEQDGVSHLAHLCGFLSIALLVYFLSTQDKKKLRTGLFINIISFAAFLYLRYRFFS